MLIQAENIYVSFRKENQKKLFGKERQQVLKGISLSLKEGECLGIVGESGSGKSTLGRVLSGLLPPDSGQVRLDNMPLYGPESKNCQRQLRHKTSIVFQDYTSSVNPRFHIRDVIGESLRAVGQVSGRKETISELLEQVGLNDSFADRYPHQLSGGQLQRVCIARAAALKPKVILLDEAVSSLDASTQVQVMDLLQDLQKNFGFSYLFITHDLTAVTYLCDRVVFLQDGCFVEQVDEISRLGQVESAYARSLLACVLKPEAGHERDQAAG